MKRRQYWATVALLYCAFGFQTFACLHKISNKLCLMPMEAQDAGCHDGSLTWTELKDAGIWLIWDIVS